MICPKMKMYDGCTVLQNLPRNLSYCHIEAVIVVPLFEATYVQGFITALTSYLHLNLLIQGVVAVDAVKLLGQKNGHGTSTDHRFSSAIFVTSPPLLRRLALHVTQKFLRYLDDELASGQLLFGESSVPEITLVQSVNVQHGVVKDPSRKTTHATTSQFCVAWNYDTAAHRKGRCHPCCRCSP